MVVQAAKKANTGLILIGLLATAISSGVAILMWLVPVPPIARVLSAALIALTLGIFFLPSLFLSYRLSPDEFVIKTALGRKRIQKSNITAASVTEFQLGARLFGTSAVAYNVGMFHVDPMGKMEVFTGLTSGTGVVLVLNDGKKLLVSPVDSQQLANALTAKS